MNFKRAILWPDTHIGVDANGNLSHDERAVNLVLDICQDIKPDHIYLLGDFADFYSVSQHQKDPGIQSLLKDEVYIVHKYLEKIQKINCAELHYVAGNHEFRLDRYIAKNCPDLFETINIEEILGLDKYRAKWHDYGPKQLVQICNSKLYTRHEPLARNPELSARRATVNLVNGHDHTIKRAKITGLDNLCFEAISCGWLGNIKCQVFDYVQSPPNWQLGFGLATIFENGDYFFDQIEIKNYCALVDGTIYKG